jgi:tetratricopeptide (TPR) repeat protein
LCFLQPALAQRARTDTSNKPADSTGKSPPEDSAFARLKTAALRAREGNRAIEACQLYEQLVTLRPKWAEGWWYLGTLYYERARYIAATVAFQKFTALDSENGQGWGLLGISEYQSREFNAALQHLTKARALGLGDNLELAHSVRFH